MVCPVVEDNLREWTKVKGVEVEGVEVEGAERSRKGVSVLDWEVYL